MWRGVEFCEYLERFHRRLEGACGSVSDIVGDVFLIWCVGGVCVRSDASKFYIMSVGSRCWDFAVCFAGLRSQLTLNVGF